MKHYVSTEVKCPFYTHEDACELHCMGFSDSVRIHVCFGSKKRKEEHKDKFCHDIKRYFECPLYKSAAEGK